MQAYVITTDSDCHEKRLFTVNVKKKYEQNCVFRREKKKLQTSDCRQRGVDDTQVRDKSELAVLGRSRVGDHVADVVHARQVDDQPFKPHAEAGVGAPAEFAQVHVPVHILL